MPAPTPIHATTAKYFPHALVSLRWMAAAFAILLAIWWTPVAWGAVSPVFQSGSGTEADPYVIADANQLSRFRDTVNAGDDYAGKHIALAADIDLGGAEWTPIGIGTRKGSGFASGSTPFAGTFDGAGHRIRGLQITVAPDADYAVGLFGILNGATVQNLVVEKANIAVRKNELAGIVCGLMVNDSSVTGATTSGTIVGKAGIGGIAGRMTISGRIANCENSAAVSAEDGVGNAGGIVGAAYYTTPDGFMAIEQCRNSGAISGTDCIGGIAGLSAAYVSRCENGGAISGTSYSIGGIVGEQKNYGAVGDCVNSGPVSSSDTSAYGVGGIVGWARYDGAAPAYSASAPIEVSGCANSAAIQGGSCAGGIVGTLYNAGLVNGNENTAPSVASSNFAAGIVGNLQNAPLSTLPPTIPEGASVENNVSETPLDAIAAPLKDTYAYNNTPANFTVRHNGTSWVAQIGPTRYATLDHALSLAGNDGTVSLMGDATAQPILAIADGRNVTLDLAGRNLSFAPDGRFDVQNGTLTIVGRGNVTTAVGPDGTAQPVASVGANGSLVLKGGSYNQDVAPYVADSFAEFVDGDGTANAPFSILPADDAERKAHAAVSHDGETVYYGDADAARAAAAAIPGATVREMNDGAGKPAAPGDEGGSGSGSPSTDDARGSKTDAAGAPGKAGSPAGPATASTANRSAAGSRHTAAATPAGARGVPQTGDALLDTVFGIVALAGVSVLATALARSRAKASRGN